MIYSNSLLRTAALAAVLGSFAFAVPVHAQNSDSMQPAPTDQSDSDAAAGSATSGSSSMKATHGEMHVEQRIKTLHAKLQITPAQESEWDKVAQTMRDNEATIQQLIEQRHQNSSGMTAIDDIKSYQQITQAHADGMQKMVAAFEPLYNDLSDQQKKNADQIFGHFEGRHPGMMGKKHSS